MEQSVYFPNSITGVAATVDALLGIPCHEGAAAPLAALPIEHCDRVFLYNPDAIAAWVYEKYRLLFAPLVKKADYCLPMCSVFPPVTPVCFASMYSGMQPAQHGIMRYEKPVLTVPTLFDDLPAAGKRAAIVSTAGDSISRIFLNRKVDYFIYRTKQECNEKALSLIKEDTYDLIELYNGDYDHFMHRTSPVGRRAIRALQENIDTYLTLYDTIQACWPTHHTALAFAPDHGCHEIAKFFGGHGLQDPCDMNLYHFWSFLKGNIEA